MRQPYGFEVNGEMLTLRDAVEAIALKLAEDSQQETFSYEAVQRECEVLDTLTNAYIAINR